MQSLHEAEANSHNTTLAEIKCYIEEQLTLQVGSAVHSSAVDTGHSMSPVPQ